MKPTEQEIQKTIIDYLRLKGYYVQRMNSGKMSYMYKGKQSFMSLADAGTPDLLAFKRYQYQATGGVEMYFIEVKRPGKKPTTLQLAKMSELQEYGAACLVATSVNDLINAGI
jgi:hypothetical protein